MKRLLLAALAASLAAGSAVGQTATPGAGSALVVGSGNYFSPIVRDLDEAVAFYRDGLGLQIQGATGDAAANPALRDMFGLPSAGIRWAIAQRLNDAILQGRARPRFDEQAGQCRLVILIKCF